MKHLTSNTKSEATPPASAAADDLLKKYHMSQGHGGIIPVVGRPDSHCDQILTDFFGDSSHVQIGVTVSDVPHLSAAKGLLHFQDILRLRLSRRFGESVGSGPQAMAAYLCRHSVSAVGVTGVDRWGVNVCNFLIHLAEAIRIEGPPWEKYPVIIFTAGADWEASMAKWHLPRTQFLASVMPDVVDFDRLLLEMRMHPCFKDPAEAMADHYARTGTVPSLAGIIIQRTGGELPWLKRHIGFARGLFMRSVEPISNVEQEGMNDAEASGDEEWMHDTLTWDNNAQAWAVAQQALADALDLIPQTLPRSVRVPRSRLGKLVRPELEPTDNQAAHELDVETINYGRAINC